MEQSVITQEKIEEFLEKLQKDGKCSNVIAEYRRNLTRLYQIAASHDYVLDKEVLMAWKSAQLQQGIAAGTVTNRTVKINQ